MADPTFPLNVQEGSPQYTLTSQITPTSSTTTISVTNTDSIEPISNAYYTIQNADGSKWCTFYVGQWTTDSTNNYTGISTYSSSNTSDVFPEGSICWCIWSKEYYDSIVTPISTINNEISTINNNISTINNEIDTLTPKVNNSFVSATKIGDSTLRLTRNNGTTVDISFPKGVNLRNVDISNISTTYYQPITISASTNELVVISGSNRPSSKTTRYNFTLGGYGYLTSVGELFTGESFSYTYGAGAERGFTNCSATTPVTFSGLLYNGGSLKYQRK